MAEDLGDQLSVQQQINKVLSQRNQLLAKQSKMLGTQIQLAAEYCKALECNDLEGVQQRLQEMNQSLEQVAENAAPATDETNRLGAAAKKGAGGFKKLASNAKKFALVAIGFKAVQAGLSGIVQTVTNIGSAFFTVVGSVWKFGKALATLPFELMGNLIGMAQSGGGGGGPSPVKLALEKIRKEMGSLASNEGKAAAASLDQFKQSAKNMAGTGLKLSQVFGKGKAGLAAAMEDSLEAMKALGAEATFFRGEFEKNAVAISMYRKGLGLTAEDMKGVADVARGQGQSMTGTLQSISNYSIQLGERFGIASKAIAKDMAGMMKDYDKFGHLGPKVMAQNAVYARKLGIEIKSLTGLIDKFDNFEDAAKGAAQLSQAFGMNVDAMKMMKEQDPSARLRMLQDAFAATGRSVKDMTRQEKNLLAQQAGLDMKGVERAFSQEGLAMSYDEITGAAGEAEKKQLTQAEAMGKLADSIERVFGGGGGGGSKFKSFFDAFVQGFGDGIMKAKPFKDMLKNIQESLQVVNKAGEKVGKMFVTMFPGVQKMMEGLGKMFAPERYQKFMDKITGAFEEFFKIIAVDPKRGVKGLINKIKDAFMDFFGDGSEGVTMFSDGATLFLETIGGILGQVFDYVLPLLTEGIEKLAKWIEKPSIPGSASEGFGKAISKVFSAIKDTLMDPLITKLEDAITKKLWPAIKKKLGEWWEANGPATWKAVLGIMAMGFLTGIASFAKGAIVLALTEMFTGGAGGTSLFKKIGGFFTKNFDKLKGAMAKGVERVSTATTTAAGRLAPNLSAKVASMSAKFAPKLASAGAKLIPGVGWAALILGSGKDVNKAMDTMSEGLGKKYGDMEGKVAAGSAGLLNAFTLGLMPEEWIATFGDFVGKITGAVGSFMDDIGLGPVMDTLFGLVNLAFSTLGGLYDIIVGIFTLDVDQVAKGLERIFDGIVDLLAGIPSAIMSLLGAIAKAALWLIKQAFMAIFVYIPKGILYVFAAIGTALLGAGKFVLGLFKTLFADIEASGGFGTWILEKITGVFDAAWTGIKDALSGAWTYFKEWAAGLIQAIFEGWGGEGDVTEPIMRFFDAIAYAAGAVVDAVIDFFSGVVDFFAWVGTGIMDGVSWVWTAITDGWEWAVNTLAQGIEDTVDFFTELGDDISTIISDAYDSITEVFGSIGDWFGEKIDEISQAWHDWKLSVYMTVYSAYTKVTDTFGKIGNWFGEKIDEIMVKWEAFKTRVAELAERAWCAFTAPFRAAGEIGSNIVDSIMEKVGELWKDFKCAAGKAWDAFTGIFKLGSPSKEGVELGNQIAAGVTGGLDVVREQMAAIAQESLAMMAQVFNGENMMRMMQPMAKAIVTTIAGAVDTLGEIFMSIFDIMTKVFSGENAMKMMLPMSKAIIDTMADTVDALGEIFMKIFDIVDEIFSGGIFPPSVLEGTLQTITEIGKMVSAGFEMFFDVIDTAMKRAVETILNGMKYFKQILEVGVPMFMEFAGKAMAALGSAMTEENAQKIGNAIVEGIGKALSFLVDIGISAVKGMFGAMASWLGISSPSRRAEEMLGAPLGGGITKGLHEGLKSGDQVMGDFMSKQKALLTKDKLHVGITGLEKNNDALAKASDGAAHLKQSLAQLTEAAADKGMVDSITSIVDNIATLGGVLSGEVGNGAVEVVKAFQGGTMEVKHTLPDTKVEVVVHLDKRALGQELVRTVLPGKQRIATTTG